MESAQWSIGSVGSGHEHLEGLITAGSWSAPTKGNWVAFPTADDELPSTDAPEPSDGDDETGDDDTGDDDTGG
ncbi:MAG: hypothetical protein AB1Z98_19745 [Nannocystaceae bacterium]